MVYSRSKYPADFCFTCTRKGDRMRKILMGEK